MRTCLSAGGSRRLAASALIAAAVLASSCAPAKKPARPASGAPVVFVAIPPQACFVKKIGGARVDVRTLVAPGQSPHTFEPTPKQVEALSRARAYFRVGMPFEETLTTRISAVNRRIRIVDTMRGLPLLPMTEYDEHAGHAEHAGAPDPHVWLDPKLVKLQSAVIRDELKRIDPARGAEFDANREAFAAELDALDAKIARALAPYRGGAIFVYHPAFGYFARSYGMRQSAVEEGGREPSARRLAEMIDLARAEKARVVFAQPQYSSKSAEAVARAVGAVVVKVDPHAEDYFGALERLADEVVKSQRREAAE